MYTKPAQWRGHDVPPILLSGNHGAIARWRRDQRLERTQRVRPDLIEKLNPDDLDAHDLEVLRQARAAGEEREAGQALEDREE